MCRAVAGNGPPGLGPTGGVGRVRVYDAADLGKGKVQLQMGLGIRGRVVSPLDLLPLQIYQDHILRPQLVVVHPAGLNGEDPPLLV